MDASAVARHGNDLGALSHPRAMTRLADVERKMSALSKSLGPPPRTAGGAVSMVLRGRHVPEVLLIERAEREGDPWSGQIAFPGGRRTRGDRSPLETARRETREEVGIGLTRGARLLGWLPPRYPANRVDWVVVPFAFHVSRPPAPRPGDEAARAFWVPLDGLPATLRKAVIELPEGELETPAFEAGGKPLWGFTFRVLCDLFDLVGWPADAGATPVPDRVGGVGRGVGDTP